MDDVVFEAGYCGGDVAFGELADEGCGFVFDGLEGVEGPAVDKVEDRGVFTCPTETVQEVPECAGISFIVFG